MLSYSLHVHCFVDVCLSVLLLYSLVAGVPVVRKEPSKVTQRPWLPQTSSKLSACLRYETPANQIVSCSQRMLSSSHLSLWNLGSSLVVFPLPILSPIACIFHSRFPLFSRAPRTTPVAFQDYKQSLARSFPWSWYSPGCRDETSARFTHSLRQSVFSGWKRHWCACGPTMSLDSFWVLFWPDINSLEYFC